MEKLKQSPAEILKSVEIQTIEQECLNRVFEFLRTRDTTKTDNFDKISAMDIARTLQFLGCRPTKADVELIIWVRFNFLQFRLCFSKHRIFLCWKSDILTLFKLVLTSL